MNMPLVLLNRRRRGGSASAPAFSPTALFSTTAIGIWLDPSDLTTMFSDRAGTTPVTTPGQSVGLRLDKSKGGEQSLPTTGWVQNSGDGVVTVTGNVITITGATTVTRVDIVSPGWVVGDYIKATVNSSIGSSTGALLYIGGVPYSASAGTATYAAINLGGSLRVQISTGSATFTVTARSKTPGNHAVAPTDAARPIYGVEPKGGRRNLVIVSEPTKAQLTVSTAGVTDAAAFGTFARSIQFPAGAVSENTYLAGETSWVSGVTATLSVYVRMDDGLAPVFGSAVTSNVANDFAINIRGALPTPNANIITDLGGGIYRVSATGTTGANASNSGVIRFATNSGRGFRVTGYTLELGSTATNYQRVTTAYDVTESGVATCHYVQYDGSDDSMSTSAIDFTGTDKMSVFAGVRKLSDAARGMLLETSSGAANGSFSLQAPNGSAANNYEFNSIGTSSRAAVGSGYVAPISNVLTGLADIAAPSITLRVNGSQAAQSLFSQGTGNYGNHALFIGRRGGTSLPFNGRDYGIIIVGKAASAGEISDTELWLSDKTAEVDVAKSISPNIYTRSGDTILDRANSIIERRTV